MKTVSNNKDYDKALEVTQNGRTVIYLVLELSVNAISMTMLLYFS